MARHSNSGDGEQAKRASMKSDASGGDACRLRIVGEGVGCVVDGAKAGDFCEAAPPSTACLGRRGWLPVPPPIVSTLGCTARRAGSCFKDASSFRSVSREMKIEVME